MTTFPLYQVDAFTTRLFAGNPAAVVPLDSWLPDAVLQRIAAENNLSETAFFVPAGDATWELRWFTPTVEVPLCGHATLASAFVLAEVLGEASERLRFLTRQSGELVVTREGARFAMRLPRRENRPSPAREAVAVALGAPVLEVFEVPVVDDVTLLAVLADEETVVGLAPDLAAVARLPCRNVIATAPGTTADFVSRMFAPAVGIDEDPVTGAAHCSLVPFWSARTGKRAFHARQVSARGGDLYCRLEDDAVIVTGDAVLYLTGEIRVP